MILTMRLVFFSLVAGISEQAEAPQLPDLTLGVVDSGSMCEDDFQELRLLSDTINLKVKG